MLYISVETVFANVSKLYIAGNLNYSYCESIKKNR